MFDRTAFLEKTMDSAFVIQLIGLWLNGCLFEFCFLRGILDASYVLVNLVSVNFLVYWVCSDWIVTVFACGC